MPVSLKRTWIQGTGRHLPGPAIDNDAMDAYIAPLSRASTRIKRRILDENGILNRHYAIDESGATRTSCAGMAIEAIQACLRDGGRTLDEVGLLACGTAGGDALMPGFASMVLGELSGPPMQTFSSHGICASGMGALEAAAASVELGSHTNALVAAAEMPSRLFKRSRYAARGYDADFDAHFLRWMLSDGAGALLLTSAPDASRGLRLRLRWIHQRSFSGDYPVCMQLGLTADRSRSHLDYAAWSDAEADGALFLRQDIRLLPHLFDVGIHEYAQLAHAGWIAPDEVDHFLCHYSSEKFAPVVDELMGKAGLSIPRERWYSNLVQRGNTGSASIFVMLDEFVRSHTLQPGQKILCFVPESGRFTVSFAMIEVEAADAPHAPAEHPRQTRAPVEIDDDIGAVAPPHDPADAPEALRHLLGELAGIWHDYRSRAWRTPPIRALRERRFRRADYIGWMQNWIPQVREGSKWMREGAASVRAPYEALADLIELHASDEQDDFMILFEDYRKAGGTVADIDQLRRNPGGEALNSYLHALAACPNPIGLLGAIYIIEGTGQRIIPALLPLMKAALTGDHADAVPRDAFRFLDYHGENDAHHLLRWLRAVEIVLGHDTDGAGARAIIDTARRTAELYLMQFDHILADQRPE